MIFQIISFSYPLLETGNDICFNEYFDYDIQERSICLKYNDAVFLYQYFDLTNIYQVATSG